MVHLTIQPARKLFASVEAMPADLDPLFSKRFSRQITGMLIEAAPA